MTAERGQAIADEVARRAAGGDMAAVRIILGEERYRAERGGLGIPFVVDYVVVDENGEVIHDD